MNLPNNILEAIDHPSEYLQFAVEVAKKAGQLLWDHYGKMHALEWKLRTDFKTEVDDQSDALIRKEILSRYPEHTIVSEESADRKTNSPYRWVIDPLGGTIPYAYGVNNQFSVCIALVHHTTPILGVICSPKINNIYVAEQGKGALWNGKPMHVSEESEINKVLMGINLGKHRRVEGLPYFEHIIRSDGVAETFSTGCYSIQQMLVAQGKLQAYLGYYLEPWDIAAATIIIREAGGKVTNLAGQEWEFGHSTMLAANPTLHGKLMHLFSDIHKPKEMSFGT